MKGDTLYYIQRLHGKGVVTRSWIYELSILRPPALEPDTPEELPNAYTWIWYLN